MSDYNWNESNYDPKTKDSTYSNNTTFSNTKFANLMNNASVGLSGRFECTTAYIPIEEVEGVFAIAGWWANGDAVLDSSMTLSELNANYTTVPVVNSQFVLKGSDIQALFASYSTTLDLIIIIPLPDGAAAYSGISADSWTDFYNGTLPVGSIHRNFIDSDKEPVNIAIRLDKREELTSNDPNGPDIILTFSIIKPSLGKLILTSTSSTGKETVTEISLGCIGDAIYELTEAVADLQDKVDTLMNQ